MKSKYHKNIQKLKEQELIKKIKPEICDLLKVEAIKNRHVKKKIINLITIQNYSKYLTITPNLKVGKNHINQLKLKIN